MLDPVACPAVMHACCSGQCLQELSGHVVAGRAPGDNAVLDLAFSPDSTKLLSASGNGLVILWGCASGKELLQLASHSTAAEAVAWRGDGIVFASSSWGGEIHVFRLEGDTTGDGGALRAVKIRELKGHSVGIDNIAWAPNQWLLASYAEKCVKLWSVHQVRLACIEDCSCSKTS
jgi:WD40 repeat protein